MTRPDSLELHLNSVSKGDYTFEVSLIVYAYISGDDYFHPNTLAFDCNPRGSNYDRTYLEVELHSLDQVREIRDFISNHIDSPDIAKEMDISVKNGKSSISPAGAAPRDHEDIEKIRLRAEGHRIYFKGGPGIDPNISTYELQEGDEPEDQLNASKLIDLFDEILPQESTNTRPLGLNDPELIERCAPLYQDGQFAEAARLSGQILEERVGSVTEELDDKDGSDLMKQAFSSSGGELQIAEDEGEQQGLMFLYSGFYQAIRNPLSHRTPDADGSQYLDELNDSQTYNILHTADFLLWVIEIHT